MDVHKPKPWHGWRELGKEIGTIVLGVLIALGAEQVVEAIHWSHMTREAEHQLRDELTEASAWSFERVAFGPCYERKLAGMAQRLASSAGAWRGDVSPVGIPAFDALKSPYIGTVRPWADTVWQTAVASGSLVHMDRDRANRFASAYRSVGQLRANNDAEQAIIPNLIILGADRQLTPQAMDRVETAISELRFRNAFAQLSSKQLYQKVGAFGISLPAEFRRKRLAEGIAGWGDCVANPDKN